MNEKSIEVIEKQNSIEINRNAKGEYAFKVKIYWNEEERSHDHVLDEAWTIMTKLNTKYSKR